MLRSLVWPIQMKSNKEVSSAFSPSSQCSRSLCEIASDFCFVSNKPISLIFTSLFLSSLILVSFREKTPYPTQDLRGFPPFFLNFGHNISLLLFSIDAGL